MSWFIAVVVIACLMVRHWSGVALYALLIAVVLVGGVEQWGFPKPIEMEWRQVEGDVIAFHLREDKAIDVMVAGDPPRLYSLPWDLSRAKEAREAQEGAGEGGSVRFKATGEEQEGEKLFHPNPVEALPPKS